MQATLKLIDRTGQTNALPGPPPRTRLRGDRLERAIACCEGTIDIVAALFNVSSKEVRGGSRGEMGIARVRQIAMYVAHCALELSMKEVGVGFGRDRTTVLHACHLVEDLREEIEFDRMVSTAERIVVAVLSQGDAA